MWVFVFIVKFLKIRMIDFPEHQTTSQGSLLRMYTKVNFEFLIHFLSFIAFQCVSETVHPFYKKGISVFSFLHFSFGPLLSFLDLTLSEIKEIHNNNPFLCEGE